MIMMNIWGFVTAAVLLTLMPGPDILFVLTQGMTRGWRAGVVFAAGLCTGLVAHVTAAALGISVLLMSSEAAFMALKFAGAAYLLYLGGAELLFMQTPAHAVINLSAEAAKRLAGQFGANFVNAVLRRIDKEKAALCALQNGHYFSRNFRQILTQDYTPEAVKAMEKYANVEAALDITLKNTADNPPYFIR